MFQQRFDYLRLPQQVADNIILNPSSIKIGTGQNAVRKIFKIQDYDQFERMQINQLISALQRNEKYDQKNYPDSLLLRYLYANKFDIQSTFNQLTQTNNILFQPGYLDLTNEIEALYSNGALYIEGRTRNHIPCIVVSTKWIDDLVLFERAAVLLCALVEDYMFYQGKVESWIAIIQTKDQSAFKMPLDRIFQIIQILQICFPNTCESIYILNTTLSINLLWSQIEQCIDPVTLNKIKFLKDKQLTILNNQFDPMHLEQSFGGQKIIKSYWPPDPNDYLYDLTQQQPIYEEEPQVFYIQPSNNLQYLNQAPPLEKEIESSLLQNNQVQPLNFEQQSQQLPLTSTEKKKKCICVKCSRDLNEVASQPRQPKQLESQLIETSNQPKQLDSQLIETPKIPQQQQSEQIQQISEPKVLDDTYVPYERQYDSVLNDSYQINPQNVNESLQENNNQNNQPQISGNEIQQQKQSNQQQTKSNQKQNKPSSLNNSVIVSQSQNGSQQQSSKQQPENSNYVNKEIQANMDDTLIDDKPDYQPKYVSKHSRPNQISQSNRINNNNPNFNNLINQPSYNPLNQSLQSQVPNTQQQLSQQNIPIISQQPQSQQQIADPIINDGVIQQSVNGLDQNNYLNKTQSYYTPQISSDPKKKYDFSQWDKYNDIQDPYPIQSYTSPSNNQMNPYISTIPIKDNVIGAEAYNKLYDNTEDYKPGEFKSSIYNFTPYDFKYSDQQYQPRIENTTKSNSTPQSYQQNPGGSQACQIF
ncbi:unnamed protein product [Paramecium primaurelia]|uniref:CRAL-TRIO domain-containing protein n=1 Tax=Paramecium primaurelia TaxID=5886 RepID=A0A8S1JWE2_PARPR|nr:unnamed protein product [Paramecium primaurelia]